MPPGPLLEWDVVVGPSGAIVRVDAEQLRPARVELISHRIHHAIVLEIDRSTLLRGHHQERPSVMAMDDQSP